MSLEWWLIRKTMPKWLYIRLVNDYVLARYTCCLYIPWYPTVFRIRSTIDSLAPHPTFRIRTSKDSSDSESRESVEVWSRGSGMKLEGETMAGAAGGVK